VLLVPAGLGAGPHRSPGGPQPALAGALR
jgi:hypothetical protein